MCTSDYSKNLRSLVKFFALVEAVLCLLAVFNWTVTIFEAVKKEETHPDDNYKLAFLAVVIFVGVLLVASPKLFIAGMLYRAAVPESKKKKGKCGRWLIFTIIFTLLNGFFAFLIASWNNFSLNGLSFKFWLYSISVCYSILEVFVVYLYTADLQAQKNSPHHPNGHGVVAHPVLTESRPAEVVVSYRAIPQTPPPDYSSVVSPPQEASAPVKALLYA